MTILKIGPLSIKRKISYKNEKSRLNHVCLVGFSFYTEGAQILESDANQVANDVFQGANSHGDVN